MRIFASSLLLALSTAASADTVQGSSSEVVSEANPTPMCGMFEFYLLDPNCKGTTVSKHFHCPSFDGPGSPCEFDKRFPGISVNDVYCDENGFYYTVYQGSETCDETEGRKFARDFLRGECKGGFEFMACTPGPCEDLDGAAHGDLSSTIPLEVLLLATKTTQIMDEQMNTLFNFH